MSQVINSAAKTFYMSAGQVEYNQRNTVINPLLSIFFGGEVGHYYFFQALNGGCENIKRERGGGVFSAVSKEGGRTILEVWCSNSRASCKNVPWSHCFCMEPFNFCFRWEEGMFLMQIWVLFHPLYPMFPQVKAPFSRLRLSSRQIS